MQEFSLVADLRVLIRLAFWTGRAGEDCVRACSQDYYQYNSLYLLVD